MAVLFARWLTAAPGWRGKLPWLLLTGVAASTAALPRVAGGGARGGVAGAGEP